MSGNNFTVNLNTSSAQADKKLGILTLESDVDWDNFLDFATWLITIIDAQFINHEIGADMHRVSFEFEDTRLFITFEDTSGSLWLELDRNNDTEVLAFIATLLTK